MAMTKFVLLTLAVVACTSAQYGNNQQRNYQAPHANNYQAPVANSYQAPVANSYQVPVHRPQYTVHQWGPWENYGQCTKRCGGGLQYRKRACVSRVVYGYGTSNRQCYGQNKSQRVCNQQCCPVNGGWNYWSNWTNHGSHQQIRYRQCTSPQPYCGGAQCYGERSEIRSTYIPKQAVLYQAPAQPWRAQQVHH